MAEPNVHARLAAEALMPDRELASFMARLSGAGAVVSFVGIARGRDKEGEIVRGLFLDHYPGMTEHSLETIAAAALDRFDIDDALVVHRCGAVAPGEPIVIAAAASAHRRAAFEAADYLMDRLKTEAMFWKREDGVDGSRWIEPTEADRADLARWSDPCPE
ncbi:molybdenum cofactor biosynthesis protein MoaE [Sphingosinicella rhizophila]|uniref:Molybdopterin synthase catalytic subunit n=1 Tax=Sphingosinicella rhizophila TaxID=3050082 RepID=A0ABU3QBY6_9SPHN|nr:molybdenum cofactor biosynthesis protein MoaE [Sphingosinicella sp. GR2756]MDT9600893.1 molybdenum cofactor biosynthesis protein MoaE [Sphingosinicella sp. GR2756]